jgi:hypothetical protein
MEGEELSLSHKLGNLANAVLIVTCFFMCTAVAYSFYMRRPVSGGGTPYRPGEILTAIPEEQRQGEAIVLVLRSDCLPCQRSRSFHAALAAKAAKAPVLRLIVVALEPRQAIEPYLRESQIAYSAIVEADPLDSKLKATPTLYWLADGVIQKQWIGRLTPAGERDVLSLVEPQ